MEWAIDRDGQSWTDRINTFESAEELVKEYKDKYEGSFEIRVMSDDDIAECQDWG